MFRFPTGFTGAVHGWFRILLTGWVLIIATHALEAKDSRGSAAAGVTEMRVHEDLEEKSTGLPLIAETSPIHPDPARFPLEAPAPRTATLLAGPMDPPPRTPSDL